MSRQERVVYLNGDILPESEASIPIRDLGFVHGDAAFDTSRTFNGEVFKLQEHIDRLYQSCKYLRIDPGMDKQRMVRTTLDVVERNVPLLGPNEDYWVTQRITRGVADEVESHPTVLIECRLLPLAERARYYRTGIPLMTSSLRRTPPYAVSPQAKTHNYLNVVLADMEVKAKDADAWVMMLDEEGNLAEGSSNNVFVIKAGLLATPRSQMVLNGISRQTVLELAVGLGIPTEERDIDLYDAYTSDEMFITSTSLCICPVLSLNGITVGDDRIPGPITEGLMAAFSELAHMDYVAQYMAHMERG